APEARDAGPERDRTDRARLVPDALVAVDVRERAREALVDLHRRLRSRDARAGRISGHLALRRRVARDERGDRTGPSAARHRDDAAGAALRADRRPGPARLHAGSAGLERGRGVFVRTARL